MAITAEAVKDLRERTGAGMMDCKRALEETAGDVPQAVGLLRERGMAAAAKKSGREAREGLIGSYIHTGGRVGALVEVNCETDFVARADEFVEFSRDVAMQIAAMNAQYVSQDEIPAAVIEKERAIRLEQAKTSGKPEAVWPKIVEGQIQKWFKEVCLLDQPFRDEEFDVRELITRRIATIGENIVVRRFARFQLGEDQ